MSPSASRPEFLPPDGADVSPIRFPTETEIYLLPDGTVVIADLPEELAPLVAALGRPDACHIDAGTPRTAREQP